MTPINATRCMVMVWAIATGCTSLKGRADDALGAGRYLEAVELYDGVLAKNPNDKEALARRTQARQGVLHRLLVRASQQRTAGDLPTASAALDELYARRSTWGTDVARADEQWLTMESVAFGDALDAAVEHAITTAGPLTGETVALAHAKVLAHGALATWRAAVVARVTTAGRAECATLATKSATPYWTWIVASYCEHFGATVARRPLPYLRGDLDVRGAVTGPVPTDALPAQLARAFRSSVWFDPSGAPAGTATVDGRIDVAFSQRTGARTATWIEQVPYTDYETTQEGYQEPYEDTEYYTEQVPHTEYQTRTEPCGDTTCTRSEPVTVYHSESKTRSVTRYRTAYRSVTNPVTRYRDETRSFDYSVTETTGRYASELRVQVDDPALAVVAAISSSFTDSGIDHDVTHTEAGVSPERSNLLDERAFFARESDRLVLELVRQLDARYAATFCSAASYTLEAAAACFYLNPDAPPAVRATLRTAFGADVGALGSVARR